MNIKNLSSLVAISLGLCLSAVSINPAHSSELTENNNDEILISQLRGHDTYNGSGQQQWDGYSLGRVAGKSGGIMTIRASELFNNFFTNDFKLL